MINPQGTQNSNYQDAIQFARLVLPTSGIKAGWRKSDKQNMFYDSAEQLVEQQLFATSKGESDSYVAIPSYQNKTDRKAENVLDYRSLMLDIDAGAIKFLKHGDSVYPTQNRAIEVLKSAIVSNKIPAPTVVVSSGEGLHVWYALDQNIPQGEWVDLMGALSSKAQDAGLKVDSNAMKSTQLARLPGTVHGDSGKTVEVLQFEDLNLQKFNVVYRTKDFSAGLGYKQTFNRLANKNAANDLNDDLISHLYRADGMESFDKVKSALVFIDPNGSRDIWLSVVWGVRHGLGHSEEAFDLVDSWSRGDLHKKQVPKYESRSDVASVWDSYDKTRSPRITVATVYKYAYENGWTYVEADVAAEAMPSDSIENLNSKTPGDIANSKLFAKHVRNHLLWNSTKQVWMYFSKGVWLLCERGEEVKFAKKVADALWNKVCELLREKGPDSNIAKGWLANAKRLQNQNGIQAMLELAKSEPGMTETQSCFDMNPWLICVHNGVYDLKAARLMPHDPSQLHSRSVNASVIEGAVCPTFEKFIDDIFLGDKDTIKYVQRFLGYCLTAVVSEDKMAFAYGIGANGKSVLANVMQEVLGTYCMTAPASLLEVQKASTGPRSDVARIAGARLVLANETNEGKPWDSQIIKQLVSTERIATRFLYGEYFEFEPSSKIFVRGNHKPTIQDSGDGMWRRLDLWPFERQFAESERDPELKDKLLLERDGILNWLIKGCHDWQSTGLKQSQRITNASNTFRSDSDVFSQWIEENCVVDMSKHCNSKLLYLNYSSWCATSGLGVLSRPAFTRRLTTKGLVTRKSNGDSKVLGIELKSKGHS